MAKPIEWEEDDRGCHNVINRYKDKDGYSFIYIDKKQIRLHRYVYELHHGEIPPGMVIRHKCDNPSCINPAHLEVGTHQDNVNDMMKRNRLRIVPSRLEANGNYHVNEDVKRQIVRDREMGMTFHQLRAKYNVGFSTIQTSMERYGTREREK